MSNIDDAHDPSARCAGTFPCKHGEEGYFAR